MKKALLIIGIVLILLGIPLTVFLVRQQQDIRQRAAPATLLALSPPTVTVAPDQTFNLDVVVDTGPNQITGAQIKIVFDPEKLEAQSIQKGTFLPNIQVAGEVGPGYASITLGAPATQPGNGTGTLAKVTMKALAGSDTPVTIRFAEGETAAVGIGEQGNVLVSGTPAVVTISGSAPNPTQTPTATPQPTATAAPTASASTTQVTKITTPIEGATVTPRPVISGTSFGSATITITVSDTTPITKIVTSSSTGSWSMTPTSDLASGSHSITVTAQHPTSGVVETATRQFFVATTGGTQVTTSSGIPVAGNTMPTMMITIAAALFMATAFVVGFAL